MTAHFKQLLILLAAVLLLSSCGSAEQDIPSSAPEITWTEIDEWPDNEFTRLIPRPEAGTPVRCAQGASAGYSFFSLELADLDPEACKAYLQAIEEAGFSPVSVEEEELSPGSVSIGNVYTSGETGLSLAYSSGVDQLALYISKPISSKRQGPPAGGPSVFRAFSKGPLAKGGWHGEAVTGGFRFSEIFR